MVKRFILFYLGVKIRLRRAAYCGLIEAENLFSHPNQDALWSCEHEMQTSLLACRKTLLPLLSLSPSNLCVCLGPVGACDG